jgi:hypothetical protein
MDRGPEDQQQLMKRAAREILGELTMRRNKQIEREKLKLIPKVRTIQLKGDLSVDTAARGLHVHRIFVDFHYSVEVDATHGADADLVKQLEEHLNALAEMIGRELRKRGSEIREEDASPL